LSSFDLIFQFSWHLLTKLENYHFFLALIIIFLAIITNGNWFFCLKNTPLLHLKFVLNLFCFFLASVDNFCIALKLAGRVYFLWQQRFKAPLFLMIPKPIFWQYLGQFGSKFGHMKFNYKHIIVHTYTQVSTTVLKLQISYWMQKYSFFFVCFVTILPLVFFFSN